MSAVQFREPTCDRGLLSCLLSWEVIVLAFYGVLILTSGMQHEPWRDEAQSWLIARDIPLSELFWQINYEGTPALWHLILMPFAKSGFPSETFIYIHLAIAFAASVLFIYKSPFSRLTKFAFLFSFYMAWEYAVIARNYNLTVLFLFAIAANYPARFTRPLLHAILIFFLLNTNVHSFFIAIGLVVLYGYEIRKARIPILQFLPSMLIIGLGIILVLLQLNPAEDNMRGSAFYSYNFRAPIRAAMNAFFPLSRSVEPYITIYLVFVFLALTGTAIFIYGLIFLLQRSLPLFLLFSMAVFGMFFLFVFKHPGGYRHHGFILIFLLFTLWISHYYPQASKVRNARFNEWVNERGMMFLINVALVFSLFTSAYMHINEHFNSYSSSKAMASYLSTLDLSDKVLVGEGATKTSSLAQYLPMQKFWYPEEQRFRTYVVWNKVFKKNQWVTFADLEQRLRDNQLDNKNTLLLLNHQISENDVLNSNYELLHKVDQGLFGPGDERYYLYQIIQ